MNCPNCNQEIPEGKKFCGHCGHRLAEGIVDQGSESATMPSKKKPEEISATVIAPKRVSPEPEKVATEPTSQEKTDKEETISRDVPSRGAPAWVWGVVGIAGVLAVLLVLIFTGVIRLDTSPDEDVTPTVEVPAVSDYFDEAEIGTEKNPIIWAVVPSGETEQVVAGFEEISSMIFDETGLVVEPFVATEYAGVIEALCTDPPRAHMTSLATFSYILAADKGCAEAALVAVRYGSSFYNGQIFVRADSGITSVADLVGKAYCRPDILSTSGWVIPSITLKAAGVDPDTDLAQILDAGTHDATVAGVYNGDCDAGSTYADARSSIEEDYPDVMDVIRVIEISADIPNDGVQFVVGFDAELKDQIVAALLAIAGTDAGQEALDTAYQWKGLEAHDDTFYDAFRQVLDAAGVSAEDY